MTYRYKLKNDLTRQKPNHQYKCGELRTDIPRMDMKSQIDMYYSYLQQKTQANFRNEGWDFEFHDWLTMWGDKWDQRGRKPGQYCMSRIDVEKAWTKENVIIWLREELIGKFTTERNFERRGKRTKQTLEEKRQKAKEYYWRKKEEALQAKNKGEEK